MTDTPYLEEGSYDEATIEKLLRELTKLGPRKVILTGISFETDKIGLAYFDKETNRTIYRMQNVIAIILWKRRFANGNLISRLLL